MNKRSVRPTNDFCPQSLFLYGTYNEDGNPDFGLFCWFSYLWDGELGVMACIGGEKRTKDNILRNRVFSANLVTKAMLPLADYLGNTDGNDPEKIPAGLEWEKGVKLPVPVLSQSPVSYELEVQTFLPLDDGEVMLCKIRNVLQDELLTDEGRTVEERLAAISPVHATCSRYYGWNGEDLGAWSEPMRGFSRKG